MTPDELRGLLDTRDAQVTAAEELNTTRPHHSRVFVEALRLACKDLREAVATCREGLNEGYATEEMIKATLLPRYIEFLRCRGRVLQDFAEIDAKGSRE